MQEPKTQLFESSGEDRRAGRRVEGFVWQTGINVCSPGVAWEIQDRACHPSLRWRFTHFTRLCKICFLAVMSASVSECLLISFFTLQRRLLIYSEVFQQSSDLFFNVASSRASCYFPFFLPGVREKGRSAFSLITDQMRLESRRDSHLLSPSLLLCLSWPLPPAE